MQQGEDWPAPLEKDPERATTERANQQALVSTLQEAGEGFVELYGIWSGDVSTPKAREEIRVKDLLDPEFYFKEQGFYKVLL